MSAAPELGTAPETCPNCGSLRAGVYCASCGQKAEPIAPTLGYFLQELMQEVVNVDGKIFRSLRLLLIRPGFLTQEIFAGRRASYISPLRLYLTASIVAFAVGALGTFDATVDFPQGTDDGALLQALNDWLPRAMFVLVPLFAALVALFYRGSGRTYPQHLYFALHVHAAWFFANAVDSAFEAIGPIPYVTFMVDHGTELYIAVYLILACRTAYQTTFWAALWRAALMGVLYLAALVLAMAAVVFEALGLVGQSP